MAKNIRSQYIRNLVADKDNLAMQLEENTKDSIRTLLAETVKDSLRDILNEEDENEKDENSFEVEEVGTETPENDTTQEPDADAEGAEGGEGETAIEDITVTGEEGTEGGETEGEEEIASADTETPEGEDMWAKLDSLKGDNGEYDLTGMDVDDAIKVLQVMGPEDNVRIVKNDNGSVTLTDDNTQKEYIIDLEGTMTGNTNPTEGETAEEGNEPDPMNEENLGYTDNYQNKTAMTTPSNNEPGKNVKSWEDGAIPTGTEKPWVGNKGDMSPYNTKVNEGNMECSNECGDGPLFEIEIETDDNVEPTMDEQSRFGKANERGMHKTPKSSEDQTAYGSHVISREGEYSGNEPNGKVNENKDLANIIRKANAIMNENKELRKIAADLNKKINEAVVINSSLAKVISLVTENATTRNEKVSILERFNEVKTVEESKNLYETISRELKSAHPVNDKANMVSSQINESRQPKASETQMYKSEDLSATLDLINRMNALNKK